MKTILNNPTVVSVVRWSNRHSAYISVFLEVVLISVLISEINKNDVISFLITGFALLACSSNSIVEGEEDGKDWLRWAGFAGVAIALFVISIAFLLGVEEMNAKKPRYICEHNGSPVLLVDPVLLHAGDKTYIKGSNDNVYDLSACRKVRIENGQLTPWSRVPRNTLQQ